MRSPPFHVLPPRDLAKEHVRHSLWNRLDRDTDELCKELRRGSAGIGSSDYSVEIRGLSCTVYRAQGHDLTPPKVYTLRELVTELVTELKAETRRQALHTEQMNLWQEVG